MHGKATVMEEFFCPYLEKHKSSSNLGSLNFSVVFLLINCEMIFVVL